MTFIIVDTEYTRRRIFDIDHLPTDIPTIDPRSNLGKHQ